MYTNESMLFTITSDRKENITMEGKEGNREPSFYHQTEKVVQQVSLRYAHEVLNALTPALGVIQMLKKNPKEKLSEGDLELLQLAQDELLRGKKYINDFMLLNFHSEPEPQYLSVMELKNRVEKEMSKQIPEFISHVKFQVVKVEDKQIFIDESQFRRVIYFIVNKWLDYATCSSILTIDFICNEAGELQVDMQLSKKKTPLAKMDDEFKFHLHLIDQNVKRNFGKMEIGDGITLKYPCKKVGTN